MILGPVLVIGLGCVVAPIVLYEDVGRLASAQDWRAGPHWPRLPSRLVVRTRVGAADVALIGDCGMCRNCRWLAQIQLLMMSSLPAERGVSGDVPRG